jgi:ribose 1,5-bisphosphokinase
MRGNARKLRSSRSARSAASYPPGRLLLVVDAHDGGSAVIVSAVRRRCADMPDLEFARCLTTRSDGPKDTEDPVSRRAFRDAERADAFLATWNVRGHRFGLPAALRERLAAGQTVVAAAPADIVPEIRAQWSDLRVIRVMAEIDAVRSALEPRLCLARMMGARMAAARGSLPRGLTVDASIKCANDAPAAVRQLTETLLRFRARKAADRRRDAPAAPRRATSLRAASD